MVKVPRVGEVVAAQLRRQIVTGKLKAGDPLPTETDLMRRYGVSRPTMREAFRILESESIIEMLRGAHGGARVLAPDESVAGQRMGLMLQYKNVPLADVYKTLGAIELAALRVVRADKSGLDTLSDLIDGAADQLTDPAQFARADALVHRAIVDLSGAQALSILASMVLRVLDAHHDRFVMIYGNDGEHSLARSKLRAYRRLLTLLHSDDVDGAVGHWRRYLRKNDLSTTADFDTIPVVVLP